MRIDLLRRICSHLGISVVSVPERVRIDSFHGDPEALIANRTTLIVKKSTPEQSALHELGHMLVMDEDRELHGFGDTLPPECSVSDYQWEEEFACAAQIALAPLLSITRAEMLEQMEAAGYGMGEGTPREWWQSLKEDHGERLTLLLDPIPGDWWRWRRRIS